MGRDDSQRRLEQLRVAVHRISNNLVELEIDSGRQLLEASTLTGQSAARWSAASTALTELWRRHGLLTDLLEQADKLRGSRRTEQLESLLSGPAIELESCDVPLAERQLMGSSRVTQRCSADELLASMATSFDDVKSVIAEISRAWEALSPQLGEARQLLSKSAELADRLGEANRHDLERASKKLERLSALISGDPLATPIEELVEFGRDARTMHDELAADAEFKRAFETRVLVARALLERLKGVAAEAQAAYDELTVKIAPPTGGQMPDRYDQLERELGEMISSSGKGQWRDLRRSLERWASRASAKTGEAQRVLEVNRAPIAARNQLRALLEAYRVKAGRLGAIERPELEAIHAQAKECLYNAPTELATAAQLVRSYQHALSDLHPSSEALA